MLTLAMLVKNEASSIEASIRSCASVANRVFLLDTGSTDDTIRLARETCASLGLAIDIYEEPFVDFAASRNRCLELAEPTNEFVLMLSGDETLVNGAALVPHGAFSVYALPVLFGANRFDQTRLFRSAAHARYVGPVHEYVNVATNARGRIADAQVFHDTVKRDPVRAAARFREIDLPLLLKEVDVSSDPRWVFYLAQTYECLGETENAVRWYRERIKRGGWHEETFHAHLRVAALLTDRADRIATYEAARKIMPHRAEPFARLAEMFRDVDWRACFSYSVEAYRKPFPKDDTLFIDRGLYEWYAAELVSIAAWYVGEHEVGREATLRALSVRPDRPHLQRNLSLYESKIDFFGAPRSNEDVSALERPHDRFFVQKTAVSRALEGMSRVDAFSKICAGKRVLHIGCVDWPITDPATSLHVALDRVCASLDGLDTQPSDALRPYVRGELFSSWDEVCAEYDVVLVPEVLEHVDDVRGFLRRLEMVNAKQFVITVPDAMAAQFERTEHGIVEVVHPDHRCWFSPHTLRTVVEKNTSLQVRRLFAFNRISVMLTATKEDGSMRLTAPVSEDRSESVLLEVARRLPVVTPSCAEAFEDARSLAAVSRGEHGSIPRVIHQLWIGPKRAPAECIASWKTMNPGCEHILWDEARIATHLTREQIEHAMTCREINGQADVLRYHLLAKFGGVFVDADAMCLRGLPEELFGLRAWTCYEDERVRPGLLAAGYMGCEAGHPVLQALSERCSAMDLAAMGASMRAWQYVGPQLLTNVAAQMTDHPIAVFPARVFIGHHYSGARSPGPWPRYATQAWGSTLGYESVR